MERKVADDYPQELLDLFHDTYMATSTGALSWTAPPSSQSEA